MEVKLSKPITVGNQVLDRVTVKPLTLGDNEDALQLAVNLGKAKNQFSVALCLLSKATGIPYDKLRSLDMHDWQALIDAMNLGARPTSVTVEQAAEGK